MVLGWKKDIRARIFLFGYTLLGIFLDVYRRVCEAGVVFDAELNGAAKQILPLLSRV